MSLCSSRFFLVLLLGAALDATRPSPAVAGEKIQFSRASETMAVPQAEHPDLDSSQGIPFGNQNAALDMSVPFVPGPAILLPVRQGNNGRNGRDGYDPLLGNSQDNNQFDYRDGSRNNNLDDMNSATNANRWSMEQGWVAPAPASGFWPGKSLDAKTGLDSRSDFLNPSANRGSQNGFGSLDKSSKDWSGAGGLSSSSQDGSSRPSLYQLLHPGERSMADFSDPYKSRYDPSHAVGETSASPVSALASPESPYNYYNQTSSSLDPYSATPTKADDEVNTQIMGQRAWENQASRAQSSAPLYSRPQYSSPSQGQHAPAPAILAFPRKPGQF